MQIDRAIRGRRSIRRFRRVPVPRETVREIIDLARHAPSSMDGQPWHFLVVTRPAIKSRLAAIKNRYVPRTKRAYPADSIREAPAVIVVCVDRARSHGRAIENGVLASALVLLAAHAKGFGAVYLSAYRRSAPNLTLEIRRLLRIPARLQPITLIPIGRPAGRPSSKALRDLSGMLHYETFGADGAAPG